MFYDLRALPFIPNSLAVLPAGLILVFIACVVWFTINKSKLGRYIYAVGSNNENAFASGISTSKVQICAYIINASFIFLCALYFAGQNGAGSANIGNPLTLQAVASAVVGGVAISGGKGGVFMSIAGALIMGLVSKLLYMLNVPNSYQTLVSGIIIIVAISSSAVYDILNRQALVRGGISND
jgi:ribose/xylose/arabinose/galactoside ABC-type transport system permease subunit